MSRGVVYVATGQLYVDKAAMSIGSLRRFWQGPVMILTDTDAPYLRRLAKHFCIEVVVHNTKEADAGKSSRILKTQAAKLCSYDETLFLDADTLVLKPLGALWDAPTAEAPLAMTLGTSYSTVKALDNPHLMARAGFAEEYRITLAVTGPDAPYHSSSTMVWHRTLALLELFRVWHLEWQRLRISDMPALARALARTGVGVAVLPGHFNSRNKMTQHTVIYTARTKRMSLTPAYTKLRALRAQVDALMKG